MSKDSTENIKQKQAHYIAAIPFVFIALLLAYKTNSSIRVLSSTWTSGTINGRPEVVAFGPYTVAVGIFERSINYFLVIWPALVFGILIGAAVRAFISPDWFARLTKRRSVRTQLAAGLAGTPLMLCSCCVAPVFTSVAKSSVRLGPAIGLMLASPALNPAALALTFMLFNPRVAAARLILAVAAVLFVGPAVEQIFRDVRLNRASEELSAVTEGSTFVKFLDSIGVVTIRTVPGLIAGVVASMMIVQWLPAHVLASQGAKFAAVLITATIAVPLALPTFLELPLALSLLAAGFPAGAAVAFLFAGPAVNLPSLLNVAGLAGWKPAALIAILVWALAVIGGLLAG